MRPILALAAALPLLVPVSVSADVAMSITGAGPRSQVDPMPNCSSGSAAWQRVAAPSRNRPKMDPMYHGSAPIIVLTVVQPATFSSSPRGMAMVMLAHRPRRFVRSGGAE